MGSGVVDTRGTVLVHIARADDPKCICVPDTVIGDAPLINVIHATAIAFGAAAITWPAIVKIIGVGFPEARGTVDVFITRANESKCIRVSDMVIGGAPRVKIVPEMEIP